MNETTYNEEDTLSLEDIRESYKIANDCDHMISISYIRLGNQSSTISSNCPPIPKGVKQLANVIWGHMRRERE